jgi:hypothetical protein
MVKQALTIALVRSVLQVLDSWVHQEVITAASDVLDAEVVDEPDTIGKSPESP